MNTCQCETCCSACRVVRPGNLHRSVVVTWPAPSRLCGAPPAGTKGRTACAGGSGTVRREEAERGGGAPEECAVDGGGILQQGRRQVLVELDQLLPRLLVHPDRRLQREAPQVFQTWISADEPRVSTAERGAGDASSWGFN